MCTSMWTIRTFSWSLGSTNIAACDGSIFVTLKKMLNYSPSFSSLLNFFRAPLFPPPPPPCAAFSQLRTPHSRGG